MWFFWGGFVCVFVFLRNFLDKSICRGYPQVNAIQMGTHNICFNKEVDKKYTGCILKTKELVDCAFIGVLR